MRHARENGHPCPFGSEHYLKWHRRFFSLASAQFIAYRQQASIRPSIRPTFFSLSIRMATAGSRPRSTEKKQQQQKQAAGTEKPTSAFYKDPVSAERERLIAAATVPTKKPAAAKKTSAATTAAASASSSSVPVPATDTVAQRARARLLGSETSEMALLKPFIDEEIQREGLSADHVSEDQVRNTFRKLINESSSDDARIDLPAIHYWRAIVDTVVSQAVVVAIKAAQTRHRTMAKALGSDEAASANRPERNDMFSPINDEPEHADSDEDVVIESTDVTCALTQDTELRALLLNVLQTGGTLSTIPDLDVATPFVNKPVEPAQLLERSRIYLDGVMREDRFLELLGENKRALALNRSKRAKRQKTAATAADAGAEPVAADEQDK